MNRLVGVLGFVALSMLPGQAATNLISADEIPPLRPPRGEIPPGFWELYGTWVYVGAAVLVVLAALVVWLVLRPKPPPVLTPPAVQAHHALEALRAQPENGVVLSRVSQIVRHYFSLSFGLPPAERTTAEFTGALRGRAQVPAELSGAVSDFLRACDERKFAPAQTSPPLNAVTTAEGLVQQAEAKRAAPPLPGK